jgi:hypothetical protein
MTNITGVSISCVAQPAVQTVVRSANLFGASEFPTPVATNASGAGGVIVNSTSLAITGGVTLSGLTPTSAAIFQTPGGAPTINGPAIINLILAADGATAIVPSGTVLTAGQYASLLAGELYFNVDTAANPNGEIRGQIQLQGGVAAGVATLDKSQVVPPTTSTATGTGTVLADLATGKVLISYITHNVANATAADIHTGTGAGSTVVGFTNLQTGIDLAGNNLATPPVGAMMSAQNLADFSANLLYFNVDTMANPNGEIRGNIAPQ